MVACLDCGRPGQKGSRCSACKSKREAEQGNPYDWVYEQERNKVVAEAGSHCPNCGEPYTAANPPTGGHRVAVRRGGTTEDGLVAHCRRCNSGWRKTGL